MNHKCLRPAVLIALDDTDNADSIGTGRLGRILAERLAATGYHLLGVTRHQHLVHPDIPYTSHNSSCAIALAGPAGPVRDNDALLPLHELCAQFLAEHPHDGADPGLCVAAAQQITGATVAFGRRTQRDVVTKADAQRLARDCGILLSEHGGTGQGVIGALAAVALRADGNDGRFLDLPGIRELDGTLTVGEILKRTPISAVVNRDGIPLHERDAVFTGGWVRPDLRDHQPVLLVRRLQDPLWTCAKEDEGCRCL